MAKKTVKFLVDVEFDGDTTDAESLAGALSTLMETALSTPGVLDEYGPVDVGSFYPGQDEESEEDEDDLNEVSCKFCGKDFPVDETRPHRAGGCVCSNCWDDRLKTTE